MDSEEARRLLYTRIQNFDSQNALKIMGYLLIQDWSEQDLLWVTLGSDVVLYSLIAKAKKELGLFTKRPIVQPGQFCLQQEQSKLSRALQSRQMSNQMPAPGLPSFQSKPSSLDMPGKWSSPSTFDTRNPYANAKVSLKPCVFFSRGYCKHGNSCRFLHYVDNSEAFNPISQSEDHSESTGSDDGLLSIDCLEQELRELLQGTQVPVSIASLPQLYYERFGKSLQAEGYLTEGQRHGKVGYNLTKLLMKLKGTVTLIERPHGQHAVLLTEDAHKFMENQGGLSAGSPASRQIYLTFPPESTFSEEDVTLHFRSYGPVQDVRIPYQQKRMFGFVTFVYPETVVSILAEGNPHYICGARVLVKPYKEKGKLSDRKLYESQFKCTSPANYLPAVVYPIESSFSRHDEDDLAFYLERKLAALELIGMQVNLSSAKEHISNEKVDEGTDTVTSSFDLEDDAFAVQSNVFKYVLDLLEGESKGPDTPTPANTTATTRSNPHTLDDEVQNLDVPETFAGKIKGENLPPQI